MINLLQQSNLWNNQDGTSEGSYGKPLLLQLHVVVLQLLYRVAPSVLQPAHLVHRPVGAPAHLLQDLEVLAHVVHPDHRPLPPALRLLRLLHLSHLNRSIIRHPPIKHLPANINNHKPAQMPTLADIQIETECSALYCL